jgi:hypothetical protein
MWRLIFSKKKLTPQAMNDLKMLLEDISYSCGATFSEINLPDSLKSICIKEHKCYDITEKLYYSCNFEPICIHCGTCCEDGESTSYPQCQDCYLKSKILRRQRKK